MLRRRGPRGRPYPKIRLALVVAATVGAVAVPTPAQFTFGTHYAALYNAETLKSEVFQSVRTPPAPTTGAVPELVQNAVEEADEGTSFVLESLTSPAPAQEVRNFIYAGPQDADYSGRSILFEPLRSFAAKVPALVSPLREEAFQGTSFVLESLTSPEPTAPPSTIGEFSYAPPQADLTQLSQVFGPTRTPIAGALGEFVYSAPQQNLTQYSWIFEAATGPALVGEFVYASPQADLTQFSRVFKAAASPVSSSLLGEFLVAPPQAADLTLQAWLTKPLIGPPPPVIGAFVSVPPQPDLTQRSSVFPYTASGIVVGPTVKPFVASQQQVDPTQWSRVFPPAIAGVILGPTVRPFVASQQQLDLTQQAEIFPAAAAPPPVPSVVGTFVSAPPQPDLTTKSWVFAPSAAAVEVPAVPIIRQLVSLQRQVDPTQQAVLFPSAPTAGVVIPSLWAAPQYDLTTRSWVQTSASVPPPSVFLIQQFVSNQFQLDPTLQAIFIPSTMEGIVIPPEPPVEAGAIPAGGKATYVKRKKSRIEELRELLAKVGAPEPIVGFPAATEAPAVVVPTLSPKLTLEAQQRDLRRTAQRVQDLKSAQDKIAQLQKQIDDDDDDEATLLLS